MAKTPKTEAEETLDDIETGPELESKLEPTFDRDPNTVRFGYMHPACGCFAFGVFEHWDGLDLMEAELVQFRDGKPVVFRAGEGGIPCQHCGADITTVRSTNWHRVNLAELERHAA